jgi:hypothetical protein
MKKVKTFLLITTFKSSITLRRFESSVLNCKKISKKDLLKFKKQCTCLTREAHGARRKKKGKRISN